MRIAICLLGLALITSIELYERFHKNYEVLGIAIDPIHGGMTAKSKKFRTMKEAQKCYADCKSEFATVCIIER